MNLLKSYYGKLEWGRCMFPDGLISALSFLRMGIQELLKTVIAQAAQGRKIHRRKGHSTEQGPAPPP